MPGAIASLQTQREAIANSANTNPAVLKQLDSTIGIYKSNLKALDAHADDVFAKQTAQKAAQAKAVSDATLSNKEALQDNAASNKPQKAVSDEWRQGATTMQKNKADLAENMVLNANSVASILMRRPDIVGAVAGRFTNAQQMMGNNDRDIAALGTAIHNIAMANNGIHGMKSNEGVKEFEGLTLNHFKNGPMAVAGALGESTKSVQSFIDAARPDTYKTHSKNGGAIKAMVSQ